LEYGVVVVIVVVVVVVVIVVVVPLLKDFLFRVFFLLLAFSPTAIIGTGIAELAIAFVVAALLHALEEAILATTVAKVLPHPEEHVVVIVVVVGVVVVVIVVVVIVVVVVVVVSLHGLENVLVGAGCGGQQQNSAKDENLHD